jgi:hypothetical protein
MRYKVRSVVFVPRTRSCVSRAVGCIFTTSYYRLFHNGGHFHFLTSASFLSIP